MFRLSLYVLGISAFVAAWAIYRNEQKMIPMPVTKQQPCCSKPGLITTPAPDARHYSVTLQHSRPHRADAHRSHSWHTRRH